MKKIILLLCIVYTVNAPAWSQKISDDKVPASVKQALHDRFPDAGKVKWELEKEDYEAGFDLKGQEMSVNFDSIGNWLETEREIKVSELPIKIQSALKQNFTAYKINEASEIESAKNGKCYEAEIEKGEETLDVLFSAEGKVISKTMIEPEEEDQD